MRATIKEALVPYHPEVKKIRVIPNNIKFLFLFLKYFNRRIKPSVKETINVNNNINKNVFHSKLHQVVN